MLDLLQKPLAGFCMAALTSAAALLVTSGVDVMWQHTPFALSLVAVIVTTHYAGRGPGFVALLISLAVCDYFLIPPYYSFIPGSTDLLQLCTFAAISILLVLLISNLRTRERSLLASEKTIDIERARLLNTVANVPGVVWETLGNPVAADQTTTFVNDYFESLLGYSAEESAASPAFWFSIVHPDDQASTAAASTAVFSGERDEMSCEFRWLTKGGDYIWVEARSVPIRNDDGQIVGLRGVTVDITARKRAADERRILSEIMQAAIASTTFDAFLEKVHRSVGEIIYAENCYVLLHDTESGKDSFAYWADKYNSTPPPEASRSIFAAEVLRTGNHFLTNGTPSGSDDTAEPGRRPASWIGVALSNKNGIVGLLALQHYELENAYTAADLEFLIAVGDQIALAIASKEAGRQLRQSEQRYRDLVENATDIIYTQDLDGSYTSINRAAERITGYTKTEALRMNLSQVISPGDLERVRSTIAAKLSGTELPPYEVEIVTKHGDRVALDVHTRVIYEDGVAVGIQGIARGITERKAAEAAMARLAAIVESSEDAIIGKDAAGKITSLNPGAENIFGYSSDEVLGQSLSFLIPPDRIDREDQFLMRVIQGGHVQNFESVGVCKTGRVIDLSVTISPIKDRSGNVVGASRVARDITETKAISDALKQTEREQRELTLALQRERTRLMEAHAVAKLGSWHQDLETKEIIWSIEAHRIFGTDPETFQPTYANFLEIVHPEDRDMVDAAYRKSLEEGTEGLNEHRLLLSDGAVKFVEARWRFVRDAKGDAVRAVGTIMDITDRRKAEIDLIESNQKFEQLANTINDVFWIRSRDMAEVLYLNPAFETIWGRRVEDLYENPQNWLDFVFVEDRDRVKAAFAALVENSVDLDIEYRIVRPKGDIRWVRVRGFEIRNDAGEVIRYAGIVTDHTERRLASDALRESEIRYHSLFERMIEGYAYCETIYGNDGQLNDIVYLEVNRAFSELTGLTDVVGKRATEVIPAIRETNPELFELYGRVARTGEPAKFETYLAPLDVWLSVKLYGPDPDHLVAVFENITERKQIAAHLEDLRVRSERRERMLTRLLSSMTDFAQIYDREGRIVFANQPLLNLWGKTMDEVAGKSFSDLHYPPDLAAKLQHQLDHVFTTSESVTDETAYVGPDGSLGYYEYIFTPAFGPDGEVEFVVGSTRVVTERRIAEERLRSSQEDLIRSQRIAHLGSWEIELPESGRVDEGRARWSDEVFRILGYEPHEIPAAHPVFFQAIHPDDRNAVGAEIERALREGTGYQIDHRIVSKDGRVRFVDEHCEVILDPLNGQPLRMVGTVQDITGQKELGEQLRQSQKMEAVGVLAGGIAHDFNNLLTAINGYSDLTLKKMSPDDPLLGNVREVREAGRRASQLTGQLLAISRKQVLKSEVINLNNVVSNIENMLRRIIRENVDLRTELASELRNARADPGQIEQVILNLVINAGDAMPQGGTITVRTENLYLTHEHAKSQLSLAGGHFVKMTVTDTGVGIDGETQVHIFDPFFSTKSVGKGTGLGLSTVYGIVKQSGGEIRVTSEVGKGTTFDIYLPCVDEKVEQVQGIDESEIDRSGTETILLAEDEETVRALVSEILESSGYKVLQAPDGEAALAICQSYGEPIHLLLSDVVMPKMGGAELRDRIAEMLPGTKVLFMSGYVDDAVADLDILNSKYELIEKPFTPNDLCERIRLVLDKQDD